MGGPVSSQLLTDADPATPYVEGPDGQQVTDPREAYLMGFAEGFVAGSGREGSGKAKPDMEKRT
jgi:hypothetical protein